MKVIGSYVSPYVRKVVAVLNLKGLGYEIDPITPFYGDAAFEKMSPLRRIPVLVDGDLALCDSSVICQYLEDAYPARPILPADIRDRARARWLEEFADSRMGDVFIWGLFYPKIVHPAVFGAPGDAARIEKTLSEDAPAVLDYLETQVPADGFLFGDIGLADISLATFFRNAAYARFQIDAARWPKTAAFVARAFEQPCLKALEPFEAAQIRTSPAGRREALEAAGAPLCAETVGTSTPQASIMLAN
jgi:glutathione S-transferase